MRGKTIIILNPSAKSEKAKKLKIELQKTTQEAALEITQGANDAKTKAANALIQGANTIVAAGGDGTINEVLNGMMGSDAALGIIPIGSVNVLARELKIPLSIPEAWDVIEKGSVQSLDLVRVDYRVGNESKTRYFIQLAGVGLDAEIVRNVTWEKKRRWGPFSYVFEFFRSSATELPSIRVKVDGGQELQGSFALIGNGSFYGGPFPIFHKASMTDGMLDVCVFKSAGLLDLLVYFQSVLRGSHVHDANIEYRHAQTVEISADADVPLEIDGEFVGHLPAKFQILPKALKVIVP